MRRRVVGLAAFAILLTLLPVAVVAYEAGSPAQEQWNRLFMTIFWAAVVVAVVVYGALLYALVRFRARKGGPAEGPHIHGNTRLEIAWTIAPALVMGWLLVISFTGLMRLDAAPPQPEDFVVKVTGSRFLWTVGYPDGSEDANGTLRVEQNRYVGVDVTSSDVIHAFSIQGLAVMIDAIPGRVNHVWFQATVPGEYPIRCRELCGAGHSAMLGTAYVFPEGSEGARRFGWPPAPPRVAPPTAPEGNNTTAPAGNNTTAPAAQPQGRVISVTLAPGFKIEPATLSAEVTESVTFDVTNADGQTHNFYVGTFQKGAQNDGANWTSKPAMKADERDLVVATLDGDATYEYWCNIPGHRDLGMKGVLTVGKGGAGPESKRPLLPGFETFIALAGLAVALAFAARRR